MLNVVVVPLNVKYIFFFFVQEIIMKHFSTKKIQPSSTLFPSPFFFPRFHYSSPFSPTVTHNSHLIQTEISPPFFSFLSSYNFLSIFDTLSFVRILNTLYSQSHKIRIYAYIEDWNITREKFRNL